MQILMVRNSGFIYLKKKKLCDFEMKSDWDIVFAGFVRFTQ